MNIFTTPQSKAFFEGRLIIFVSGFTMLMTQVVLLRELAALYVVNELIVGVLLSFWLLFAGLGAFTGRYMKGFGWHRAGVFPLLSGTMAFVSLWVLYLMRIWWLPAGVVPALSDWLVVVVAVTFFFCFPSGLMFTWFSAALSNQMKSRQTEYVYIFEQAGSLLAGVAFYLFSSLWLNAFWVMSLLLATNLMVGLYMFRSPKALVNILGALGMLFFAAFLFVAPQYQFARRLVHGHPVERSFFSPYGSIDMLERGNQKEVFGSGRFFSYHLLSEEREEMFHPALLLHPFPRRLLLVNPAPGITLEALRYDSLDLFFVSADDSFIKLEEEMLGDPLKSERIHFIHADPLRYLRQMEDEPFDVIIVGGGVPYTLEGNRYCTEHFFSLARAKLNPQGILMCGGIEYAPFWSPARREMLRVFYSTLKNVFPEVQIWAGNSVLFLGSDHFIGNDWWQSHPHIVEKNLYIRRDYFPDYLMDSQTSEVMKVVEQPAPVNSSIKPVLFGLSIKDLSSFWDVSLWWFVGVFGILFLSGLIFFRGVSSGVFLTGFVLGGMQILLLLMWQMVMGNLFRATGLMFSLFMAGLAIGAWSVKRLAPGVLDRFYPIVLMVLGIAAISALPLLNTAADSAWFVPLVLILVMALAFLGGAVFASALALQPGSVSKGAARVYGADVAGGAIGSFVTAIFMVPFAGLINAGYLTGLMLLLGGLLLLKRL